MTNIYRLALQVQDASNPAGVINSLAREVVPGIQAEAGYQQQGTQYLAKHPALLLFLDKLVSLTGEGWVHDHNGAISDAYSICNERAEGLDAVDAVHARDADLPYYGKPDSCYGCGMVEPMGRHYVDCTLLENGDEVVAR